MGAGTGRNLQFYPPGSELTLIDLSPGMLRIAREGALRLGLQVTFRIMDVHALAFPDDSFNTVVSTLSLCTFVNPIKALSEMSRVCRSDGRILLLEHGRSDVPWINRLLDRLSQANARHFGCYWNRDPVYLVQQAGLEIIRVDRHFFGMIYCIRARPRQ